ncbi:Mth938-like domain-containing protein [Amylibacter sp. IMCC11727]|uniref:Mth938-like domain-containing protein n=1 Tax=Amylibacter sp. IMCC11727 TaxID=3039851 RepID=UPI00244E2090|nr:Mth938-like domain-containing protein [Amylibacter sp. IMCC11727]WGI23470.1 Mth938-like domain-containing protein [Amylibacter sp. IMCC11727]
MQLNEVKFEDQVPVDGYGPGFFRVADQVYNGAMFLTAEGVKPWGGYADLTPLIDSVGTYDFVFVGTGADIAPVPKDIRETLENAGVAIEVMSSPSACRTYNILLSEGRRVALAVLPV